MRLVPSRVTEMDALSIAVLMTQTHGFCPLVVSEDGEAFILPLEEALELSALAKIKYDGKINRLKRRK